MTLDAIAFAPHPDDVELGCSGSLVNLIDRGYRVAIADLTEARLATGGDPVTRATEAEAARAILGVQKRYQLKLFEGSLNPDNTTLPAIVSLIRATKPYIVFAPYWEDRHPDHRDGSRLIQAACFWSGVAKFGDDQPPHRPHRILYYFLHWDGPVSAVVDISSSFNRKLSAIRAYHSQFSVLPGEREMTYISRPEFLERVINRARYYGSLIGAEYGEPLYSREMMRLEDLMAWAGSQGAVG